jgi:hypothetical protein
MKKSERIFIALLALLFPEEKASMILMLLLDQWM